MTELFSTPASHAFDHSELLETGGPSASSSNFGNATEDMDIEAAFEVEDTVSRILEGGYKTIGLQFPDELLPKSVKVFKAIQKRIAAAGAQAYVLADSTYGSCCPDVLSCLHLPADFLVHYGHACLTPTSALPVHYVFPRVKLDVSHAARELEKISKPDLEGSSEDVRKGIIVVWDVGVDWLADEICSTFSTVNQVPISFATIQRPAHLPNSSRAAEKAPALRSIEPPSGLTMAECVILYIGEEGRSLLNLQMTHAGNPLYAYSPSLNQATALHPTSSRLLSRRLFAVHQAMSADIFGLIVGNVGLAHSQPLLAQLRRVLAKHRKKSYTLSVGRLNPAKLANFETIECFVLVGCAEGGVVDSKDFYRPIITPWELLLSLQGPEGQWEPSKWTLDIASVLKFAEEQGHGRGDESQLPGENGSNDQTDPDDPQFDLVTGTLRTRKVFGRSRDETPTDEMDALTLRNQSSTLIKLESAGSRYLSSRQFKGLEARVGMDEPASLEQGRSGIARGYEEEK
ncbi:peptidyl-diphthamide biosynthesis [Kockovaella imperatae]|uniref:2-(3-amino-3-carboxypropyl)histidine synthase subunit 2 n=1 Tax=Kockovaella imperatae TaxID=4999 RepID=A0A1Y1UIY4_9TREE|nr:peptidyl-diphthamide biosynthesis [Kockovaella imperatae]ORX37454.1 peptidyl-diphthamide biosynthesis [Kockovaella imperatae]